MEGESALAMAERERPGTSPPMGTFGNNPRLPMIRAKLSPPQPPNPRPPLPLTIGPCSGFGGRIPQSQESLVFQLLPQIWEQLGNNEIDLTKSSEAFQLRNSLIFKMVRATGLEPEQGFPH